MESSSDGDVVITSIAYADGNDSRFNTDCDTVCIRCIYTTMRGQIKSTAG